MFSQYETFLCLNSKVVNPCRIHMVLACLKQLLSLYFLPGGTLYMMNDSMTN